VRCDADRFLSSAASQRECALNGIVLSGRTCYGNPQCKNVTLEVFYDAILIAFHGEENLSNQVRQALDDSAFAAMVGEGEDGFDEARAGSVQEVCEGDRGRPGEEIGLAEGTGTGDADVELLRESRRKEPFRGAQAHAGEGEGYAARERGKELDEELDAIESVFQGQVIGQ
jgi:hypothetical protein